MAFAAGDLCGALTICSVSGSALGRLLSSVSSWTNLRTSAPKRCSISSGLVWSVFDGVVKNGGLQSLENRHAADAASNSATAIG